MIWTIVTSHTLETLISWAAEVEQWRESVFGSSSRWIFAAIGTFLVIRGLWMMRQSLR